MIIAVLNQKGGSGKTMLSLHIATDLSMRGQRIILGDADPQKSARGWSQRRKEPQRFPVIGMDKDNLHEDAPGLAAAYDHMLIDCPPSTTDIMRSALLAAQLALIPIQPSSFDIWAAEDTVKLIKSALYYNPDMKTAFVINRKVGNTLIGREAAGAISKYAIPVLNTNIASRTIFATSGGLGSTALEDEPSGEAAGEIKTLVNELMEKFIEEKQKDSVRK